MLRRENHNLFHKLWFQDLYALPRKNRSRAYRFLWERPRENYLIISKIIPAPTVRLPSRIANRIPTSIAIG